MADGDGILFYCITDAEILPAHTLIICPSKLLYVEKISHELEALVDRPQRCLGTVS